MLNLPDLDWYWWIAITAAAVALAVWLRRWFWEAPWSDDHGMPNPDDEPGVPHVVYYVDEPQLRQLADSCDMPLPAAREITSNESRRLGSKRVAGVERGKSETISRPSQLNLDRIARKLRFTLRHTANAMVDDLEWEPHVPSKDMIQSVADRIRERYGEAKSDLLAELLTVLDEEITETVLADKRTAFQRAADGNKSLYVTGYFERADDERGYRVVRLAKLFTASHDTTDIPPGIDLRILFANDNGFTDGGRERLDRPQPFFGRLIAHSPTYDNDTGVLTASAVAAWGLSRDAVQLDHPSQRYTYGC